MSSIRKKYFTIREKGTSVVDREKDRLPESTSDTHAEVPAHSGGSHPATRGQNRKFLQQVLKADVFFPHGFYYAMGTQA
jgi:hypothetical protein